MTEEQDHDQAEREKIRQRIRSQIHDVKVHEPEGEYKFDNPDLEYKTKRQKKTKMLEEKYKDKPKIAFHKLTDEGNLLFMQAKRDKVTTTIGWSIIGNFAGLAAVQALEARQSKSLRLLNKQEFIKVGTFLFMVASFTGWGYGSARQTFVRQKMEIVEKHSVQSSDK